MVNVSLKNKCLIVCFCFLPFFVLADSGTAWDLDALQKQRVLYEAKAAVNKAKAEAESGEIANSTNAQATTSVSVASHHVDVLPQLVKVNGRNAVISMNDGSMTTVSAGQMLPGGRWQVISVGLSGVKVKNIATQKVQTIN